LLQRRQSNLQRDFVISRSAYHSFNGDRRVEKYHFMQLMELRLSNGATS
jgi:hypothetical protein